MGILRTWDTLAFSYQNMTGSNPSYVNKLQDWSRSICLEFPKRSNDLQISFKFSIICFWNGQWGSCLNSFGEPKGKIGPYGMHKRLSAHTLGCQLLTGCKVGCGSGDSRGERLSGILREVSIIDRNRNSFLSPLCRGEDCATRKSSLVSASISTGL